MKYIIERLKEPSTWRGMIMVLTAFGVGWSPENQALVVSAGVGVAGLLGAVLPDRWMK